MNVEIGTEAAQFPEKEYINGIFLAVRWKPKLLAKYTYLLSYLTKSSLLLIMLNFRGSCPRVRLCSAPCRAIPPTGKRSSQRWPTSHSSPTSATTDTWSSAMPPGNYSVWSGRE